MVTEVGCMADDEEERKFTRGQADALEALQSGLTA